MTPQESSLKQLHEKRLADLQAELLLAQSGARILREQPKEPVKISRSKA